MRISKVKLSSKCKDGSLVKEYTLTRGVDDQDLAALSLEPGNLGERTIGGNRLFTYTSDLLTMKGMYGDIVVYVTHRKEDTDAVDQKIHTIFA